MKNACRVLVMVMVLMLMPMAVFAETPPYEVLNPNARCTITDENGNSIAPEFDYYGNRFKDFPKNGTTVKVFYNGVIDSSPDETFVAANGTFKSGNKSLVYSVNGQNYNGSTVELLLYRKEYPHAYDSKYTFYACTDLKVTSLHAPLKRIEYSPSNVRVYSESIKQTANDGSTYYDFRRRASHKAPDGSTWKSPFAEGDKITAYFADGTSTVYENRNVKLDVGYIDYFVSNTGEQTWAYTENDKLSPGDNSVVIYLWKQPVKITTTISTFMWTPSMGAYPGDNGESSVPEKKKSTGVVKVAPVSVTKITGVKAGRTGKKLKVTWKGLTKAQRTKANRIQLQYGSNKQFRNAKSVWIKNNQKKYISKKLKKGKYYVRMRAMRKVGNKNYYSKWTAVKGVKIR